MLQFVCQIDQLSFIKCMNGQAPAHDLLIIICGSLAHINLSDPSQILNELRRSSMFTAFNLSGYHS